MAPASSPVLSFESVSKQFVHAGGLVSALQDVDLQVREGEFLAIVGPSGCGKSTLLRMAAGLAAPTGGGVRFRGKEVREINQQVGFVTQDSKLFPWLTLAENIAFPLKVRGIAHAERAQRVEALVRQVGLSGFEHAYPHELSGGMQKRASIARTLVYQPDVLLMDEPFGPLDAQTRLIMQQDLLDLWSGSRRTVLFVTHDLAEAVCLADRIVVMTRTPGRIKQVFDDPLPRPRDILNLLDQPAFQSIHGEIWNYFKTEIGSYRDGRGGAADAASVAGERVAS